MSEKLFLLLLRLYPAHFRKAYGAESLELFRDRCRDEKGPFAALRLWFDLLADFGVTAYREYFHAHPTFIPALAQQPFEGAPCFILVENEPPSFVALSSGAALSLLALGALCFSLVHFGSLAGNKRSGSELPQSHSRFSQPALLTPNDGGEPAKEAALEDKTLDASERRRVVEAAASNLRQYYAYPDVGQRMAESLLAHERNGDDDGATEGSVFADLLTKQMRDVSQDAHLDLIYSSAPLPNPSAQETPEDLARYRNLIEQQNCTFEKVQVLPQAIGYFKLNSFPETSVCRQKAAAAMASLNEADSIIFDLRDNRGGMPEMVTFIASYLFDHPEYMYNPRENTTKESWT